MKDPDEHGFDGAAVNQQSDLNAKLGSLLEQWYLRDTPGCQFCNAPDPAYTDEDTGVHEFCDEECKEAYERVFEARTTLGKRDMNQRGYD